jgi:hypothetical protein
MQKKDDLSLSKREKQLILESLLYCASLDLDHTQYKDDLEEMKHLAVRIRLANQNIPLDNVRVSKKDVYMSPLTQDILDYFPEIISVNL